MEIEREAMRKTSVQDFQWDGTEPRIDGKHVWFRSIDGSEHGWPQHTEFEAMRLAMFLHGAIAAALTAERAKFAAFADEKGEPRKVLGTLPLTVEGDIIGDGAWCWFIFPGVLGKDDDKPARAMYRAMPIVDPDAYSGTRRVHSTKQAAEAAKEKTQ